MTLFRYRSWSNNCRPFGYCFIEGKKKRSNEIAKKRNLKENVQRSIFTFILFFQTYENCICHVCVTVGELEKINKI